MLLLQASSSTSSMRAPSTVVALTAAQSGTFTPFLYKTRTLSSIRFLPRCSTKSVIPVWSSIRRSPFSSVTTSLRASSPFHNDIPVRKPPNPYERNIENLEGQTDDGPVIRKVTFPSKRDRSQDIPWKGDQREIASRTNGFATEQESIPFDNGESVDDTEFLSGSDSFAGENIFGDNIKDSDFVSEIAARHARESTITIAERQAFERIFADILARSRSPNNDTGTKSCTANNSRNVSMKPSARGRKAEEALNSIMDKAMKGALGRQTSSFDSQSTTKTQEELRADVNRYPPSLRAAAAKAIQYVSGGVAHPLQVESTSNMDDLEHIRQPERERVEGLMRAAGTDIELWQVMEQEVFSMVGKLGLEKPKAKQNSKKPRQRKEKKAAAEKVSVADTTREFTASSNESLDLTIHGPLYPSYLLLGLRLLDRSFAKPSQLVLNVLPRIKSLGLISQVLGASTAFYNELLRIYWLRYDNFLGISKLLDEMEQAGLDLDAETLSIVNDINQMQLRVRRSDRGPVLQALWSMPEFAPGKFLVWKDKIQAAIEERGSDLSEGTAWRS